ncbi:MAG TPA: hypothetical protein VGC67_01945 [Cellulomonas sp.]
MQDEDQRPTPDERPPGARPGLNDAPIGAPFRDGLRRTPASGRTLLAELLPFLLLAGAVVVLLTR